MTLIVFNQEDWSTKVDKLQMPYTCVCVCVCCLSVDLCVLILFPAMLHTARATHVRNNTIFSQVLYSLSFLVCWSFSNGSRQQACDSHSTCHYGTFDLHATAITGYISDSTHSELPLCLTNSE